MKKMYYSILYFVALCSIFSMSSCVDLDPMDSSEINPSIYPRTEEDMRSLVNGCYQSVRSSWFDGLFATNERGVTIVNDLTTEILSCKAGWMKDVSDLNFFPTTNDLTRFYYSDTDAYSDGWLNDISQCTSVLKQIEVCDFLSDEVKKELMAEVRCARGLLSYTLYDMFGPLVVAPIELLENPIVEQPLSRLSQEDMVKFIEDDLLYASTNLPVPADTEYGRFSQGLAKMLLIRLYLHETPTNREFYQKVENLCREMKDYGYSLAQSYTGMFEVGGQGKANPEIIWAIPVVLEQVSWNDWHMSMLPTDFEDHGMEAGYELVNSTWAFYDSFEPRDLRKTYLIASYTNNKGETVDREHPGNPDKHLDVGPIPLKYGYDINVVGTGGKSSIDPIIYRYADVYLSLAEALCRKPSSSVADRQEALGLINDIRGRAGLGALSDADIATDELLIDVILKERSHEFWCENGQYRADLIRLGKFVEHARNIKGTPYAADYKSVYPLPLSAINDGKGKVIQNPQY